MIYCRIDNYHAKDVYPMNHPKLRPFLRWAICIGSYWVTALVYPYNFYYKGTSLSHLGIVEILVFFALMAGLGTVLHGLLLLLEWIGKHIGLYKNLIFYFLYHFAICALFSLSVDQLMPFVNIEPLLLHLLMGFFPAMLCSILQSYHASHKKIGE